MLYGQGQQPFLVSAYNYWFGLSYIFVKEVVVWKNILLIDNILQ